MPTTLQFISPTLGDIKAQRVYWKVRWQDPWTLVSPKAWCNSAQWTANPSLPVAEIHWRYGIALEIGAATFAARFKENNRLRQYVKVEYDTFPVDPTATDPLRWYGSIEIELDDFQGVVSRAVAGGDTVAFASGKNYFTALGLESLLDTAYVTTSMVKLKDGSLARVKRAIPFNDGDQGNMSPTPGPDGVHTFYDPHADDALPWSSYQIGRYLLKYHTPKDFNDQAMLTFELGGPYLDALSPNDADHGQFLPTHGKSVRELLNVMLSRQRLTGWSLLPEDTPGGKLIVTPFTMTSSLIDLELEKFPQWKIPANYGTFRLATERDRGKEFAIKRSSADLCDQVVATGARRTSTATFSFADGTLGKGWEDDLEEAYATAASEEGDYPAATEIDERQERNIQCRSADKFKAVYARFVIPDDFEFKVGDGISGSPEDALCPDPADHNKPLPLAFEDFRFTVELALQEDFDYETLPATESTPPPHRRLKPLVVYPQPVPDNPDDPQRYRQIDTKGLSAQAGAAMDADDYWSARVRVDDGALWVDVEGDSQDAIALNDFHYLAEDNVPYADFRKMLCTLTVEWSEFASATYPPNGPNGVDAVRIFPVDAGEAFRVDYLCPNTIVAIKPTTGELVRCEAGGIFRDDRDQLKAIARIAYAWYSVTRRAISYRTTLLNSSLQIGSFITGIGDQSLQGDVHVQDINSVITSIEINSPSAEGQGNVQPPVPTIRYETAFGELDLLKFR